MSPEDLDGAGAPGRRALTGARGAAAALVVGLPSRLVTLFFWTCVVVCVAILVGAFTPVVVLPAILVVVVATWRLVPAPVRLGRDAVVGAGAALAMTVLWAAANAHFAAETLLVQRDPGFLTLQGLWLVDNADPSIPLRSAAAVAEAIPGASAVAEAFSQRGDLMDAQGAKTFPGLLAVVGWAAGSRGVLAGNVLIAGVALLALYDVARRLTSPLWALLPVGALALTLPFLYFTRTPFTEPTTLVLVLGGLAVLWSAFVDLRTWRFGLAGAMVGAGALSRIDGAAVAAGLVLALGVVAAASSQPERRRALRRGLRAGLAGAAAMVALGYADVRVNSAGYLVEHSGLYAGVIGLFVASAAAAVALERVSRSPRVTGWITARRDRVATWAAVAVSVAAVVLLSRPLWMQAHGFDEGSSYAQFIAAAQRTAGVAVDGTRSYDEMTMLWLGWYLGPVALVVGVAGIATMVAHAIRRRRAELVVLLLTLGVPALVYVVRPSITPDHVWAMRRLLPAAMPLLLLSATWALQRWARVATSRSRPAGSVGLAGVGLVAAAVLLWPLATWGTLHTVADYRGRSAQVQALCDLVGTSPVVVVLGEGPTLLPTVRIVCGSDVVELADPPTRETLAAVRAAWGDQPVLLASASDGVIPWDAAASPSAADHPTIATDVIRWPHVLSIPRTPIEFTSPLWVGRVGTDGSVTPVPPEGSG